MKLEVIALNKPVQKFKKPVVKKARKLASFLRKKGIIEVYLMSSEWMKRLNKRFRGKNQTTTVLSFRKPKGFPGRELGEVYLDPLYIQKKKQDLSLMLVHGVLHILDYDHKKKHDRIKMQKEEARLLSQF